MHVFLYIVRLDKQFVSKHIKHINKRAGLENILLEIY